MDMDEFRDSKSPSKNVTLVVLFVTSRHHYRSGYISSRLKQKLKWTNSLIFMIIKIFLNNKYNAN